MRGVEWFEMIEMENTPVEESKTVTPKSAGIPAPMGTETAESTAMPVPGSTDAVVDAGKVVVAPAAVATRPTAPSEPLMRDVKVAQSPPAVAGIPTKPIALTT
jgi:hypothetical protein